MAVKLTKCRQCSHKITSITKYCPNCGEENKKKRNGCLIICLIMFFFSFGFFLIGIITGAIHESSKTPKEKEYEKLKFKIAIAQANADKRNYKVANTQIAIAKAQKRYEAEKRQVAEKQIKPKARKLKYEKSSDASKKHIENTLNQNWELAENVYEIRSRSHRKIWYFGAVVKNKTTGETKYCVWAKSGTPTEPGLTFSVNNSAFRVSGMGMLNKTKAAVTGGDRESNSFIQFLKNTKKSKVIKSSYFQQKTNIFQK